MRTNFIKKRIICTLAVMLAASNSAAVFAAGTQLDDEDTVGEGNVHAVYTEDMPWNNIPVDENGNGQAELPDGSEVIIENADSSKRLMIDAITESGALEWIKSALGSGYENVAAYHIYYVDGDEITPADGVKITFKTKSGEVFSVTAEGKASQLASGSGEEVVFTTNGEPFYVLCDKKQAADEPSEEPKDDEPSANDPSGSSDVSSDDAVSDGGQAAESSQKPADGTASPGTGMGAGITFASLLFGGAILVSARGKNEKK